MTAKPKLRTHAFWPSGTRSYGVAVCHCGSLKTDAVHRDTTTPDQQAAEARRIGER